MCVIHPDQIFPSLAKCCVDECRKLRPRVMETEGFGFKGSGDSAVERTNALFKIISLFKIFVFSSFIISF